MIPDRPGNNRLDSFKNLMSDPRIALLFLIPGVGETLRINGRAERLDRSGAARKLRRQRQAGARGAHRHDREDILPLLEGDRARQAVGRERRRVDRKSLPSTGTIIAELTGGKLGGEQYDKEAPAAQSGDAVLADACERFAASGRHAATACHPLICGGTGAVTLIASLFL